MAMHDGLRRSRDGRLAQAYGVPAAVLEDLEARLLLATFTVTGGTVDHA